MVSTSYIDFLALNFRFEVRTGNSMYGRKSKLKFKGLTMAAGHVTNINAKKQEILQKQLKKKT